MRPLKEDRNPLASKVVLLIALSAAVLIFLVYLSALKGEFLNWDDHVYVYENPFIRSLDLKLLKEAFSPMAESNWNWHPVTILSHALDFRLWGLDPFGHHLTNNIIHSVNTALVFIFTFMLINAADGFTGQKDRARLILLASAATALIFGLHPLRVESVAWVSERKDLLCALFYILSLMAYLKYADTLRTKRRRLLYIASLSLFALSLMSKAMAVSLPLVLVVLDYYPLRRLSFKKNAATAKTLLIEKVPFFILMSALVLLTLWTNAAGGAVRGLGAFPFWLRLLVTIRGYAFYIYKLILPTKLAPLYPYPYPNDITFFSLEYLGALILLIAITTIALVTARKKKVYASVWAYYLITLLPVSGIILVGDQSAGDRFTYLPTLSLTILFAVSWCYLLTKSRGAIKALLCAFMIIWLVLLAAGTTKQISIWKDPITFWTYEIELYPKKDARIYINRAHAYEALKEYEKVIEDLDLVIETFPTHTKTMTIAHNNRGTAYGFLREYERAIEDFENVLKFDPENITALRNLGWGYSKIGKTDRAAYYNKKAASLTGITE